MCVCVLFFLTTKMVIIKEKKQVDLNDGGNSVKDC